MKTYSPKLSDISRKWYLIDAVDLPLGRLSTTVAKLLIGKDKVTYSPHIDNGDFVVIINADKLKVTGSKTDSKIYYRHSGYPGGIKSRTLKEQSEIDSRKIIEHSVKGMLPKNKLQSERIKRLKIYPSENHPHDPQKPHKIGVNK